MTLQDELSDRLLRSRTILLGAEVGDESANLINSQLRLLEAEDPKADIQLLINSPGGSVTAGLAIYDTMHFITCDVITVATGLAASMAQVLLCAGAPGKRFALPHASIMMHQGSAGVGGVAADIQIQAENLVRMSAIMNALLALHTGQSVDKIAADADRDNWFSAEEAKDYGMIDHVIANRSELAHLTGATS